MAYTIRDGTKNQILHATHTAGVPTTETPRQVSASFLVRPVEDQSLGPALAPMATGVEDRPDNKGKKVEGGSGLELQDVAGRPWGTRCGTTSRRYTARAFWRQCWPGG